MLTFLYHSIMRPTTTMSDAELLREVEILNAQEDKAALKSPLTMLHQLVPNYVRRPHLKIISDALVRISNGEIDRLLITTPPQVGKTVTAVVGGAVWWLANHKYDRIIIGSYGDSLAVERGKECRKLIRNHGDRIGLRLARGSESVQDWQTESGGGILSVGVGAGVTGRVGNIVFVDDPHKSRAEADAIRFRDRVDKWLSADITSRLSPGAPLVMIMTLWHPDDIAARVQQKEGTTRKGGRWHVIRMPAICDDPENDPLGREYGDPLPHPRIPLHDREAALRHWNDRRSSTSVHDWHALYMCNPKPAEGALIDEKTLRERRHFETNIKPIKSAVAVDPSGGGRDTAGIVAGYLGTDRKVYLTHDRTGRMSSTLWAKETCTLAAKIEAELIVVERNFGGDMAYQLIRSAWSLLQTEEEHEIETRLIEQHPGIHASTLAEMMRREPRTYKSPPLIKEVVARKNKRLRAEPVAQMMVEDRIRFGKYLPEVEQEWATWQEGSSDSPGRIDASTYLGYALVPKSNATSGGAAPTSGAMPATMPSPFGSFGGASGFGALG